VEQEVDQNRHRPFGRSRQHRFRHPACRLTCLLELRTDLR
jgi:hypothetical protein